MQLSMRKCGLADEGLYQTFTHGASPAKFQRTGVHDGNEASISEHGETRVNFGEFSDGAGRDSFG